MAALDVKKYFAKVQSQYLEMKADMSEFEQAFKDGHITEDQLDAAKEDILRIETNYQRLVYIMYLLELPNRASKHDKHNRMNKKLLNGLSKVGADEAGVLQENKSALDHFRAELEHLTAETK